MHNQTKQKNDPGTLCDRETDSNSSSMEHFNINGKGLVTLLLKGPVYLSIIPIIQIYILFIVNGEKCVVGEKNRCKSEVRCQGTLFMVPAKGLEVVYLDYVGEATL